MRRYTAVAQFVIGDEEDPIEVIDKWFKETAAGYDSPSEQFDITEHISVRRVGDIPVRRRK